MKTTKRTLGGLLREIRQQRDLGIKKVAPALGVDYTYLSKLENDRAKPSDDLIDRIANYFGCDKDLLYVAADKIPEDVMDVIRRYPKKTLQYLRNLNRDDDKSR